ncbi:hypothetical protein [Spirilliplanes yamanashiensis]|uniref:Peptide zinc metalloprotease protein n=1 Tax=Spirilliplanes yamanashiensis TaxID=42233 RepID=A0A8J3YCP8_9ACTN|nr:hypothetical protein [Spirilliplanes yamanashiensis]MDP9816628.1 putative peptide zinc metalloprotease protein [Spirilliplanes yamanashiensis]GIJ06153.1 hypothetical protein Sya03_55050 [Spirilliplanes yamanashiensis]
MRFATDVEWRVSRRGLVIAAPDGDTVLLEHPRAADLPDLLVDDPGPGELGDRLGAPNGPGLVSEMTELGILRDPAAPSPVAAAPPRVAVTRSGIEIAGIDRPAQWCARRVVPLLATWPARVLLGALVVAGAWSLLAGRPAGPQVSAHPVLDALLGIGIGLACSALHEFAHAVALAHYGRRSRRAGFGFYWGAISFYVDSTEALTLPRRARVTQALAGLAVDVVTLSLLAITAQLSTSVLLTAVAWRLAVLGLAEIAVNLAPVLQVDGHWALADLLDEPDLGPRARAALGAAVRGRARPGGLALYGALSLVCGLGLLALSGLVFWYAAHDLLAALFAGNAAEFVVGVLVVAPVAAGLLFSTLGLLLETALAAPAPTEAGR